MQLPNDVITENETEAVAVAVVQPAPKNRYFDSDQCREARMELQRLVENPSYDTDSSYYSGNTHTFIERHLQYLSSHSVANLNGYISNLKLMTKVKKIAVPDCT